MRVKQNNPSDACHFHPISLCNTVNKIVTKLTEKQVLSPLIREEKAAINPRRAI